ncbi:signal peptidase I [Streptomyces sp. WMMB 714]|uniref:signal peptidase I n=1 Tax=Streptomyces sp. WMMB 714 TaxID=1286822 RepID=UPI0005F7A9A9|nr:signal peptidase I [Streptomyces sp. WMMB 714]SCK36710.1 signal peptidase I [Streptomyces sp. WMMB 714]
MGNAGPTDTSHGRLGHVLSGLVVAVGCVLFLGAFAWGAVLYQPYTVPTNSMNPTVKAGDRVLAERIDGEEVRRGDVVVFQDSVWGSVPMVKRVVGTGGDKVACCTKQGQLSVNGKTVDEPYLKDTGPDSQPPFKKTTVPEGRLFLLGDHRMDSVDSRVHMADGDHGAVPRSAVNARVDAVAWPMSGLGMLAHPGGFSSLPGGTSTPGPLAPLVTAIVVGALMILGGAAYGPIARRAGRGARG